MHRDRPSLSEARAEELGQREVIATMPDEQAGVVPEAPIGAVEPLDLVTTTGELRVERAHLVEELAPNRHVAAEEPAARTGAIDGEADVADGARGTGAEPAFTGEAARTARAGHVLRAVEEAHDAADEISGRLLVVVEQHDIAAAGGGEAGIAGGVHAAMVLAAAAHPW